MSAQKPIVVVVGATGMQGGSVVEFLLKENKYHIRGVTRKVEGEAAKKLQAKYVLHMSVSACVTQRCRGVEVVAADIGKKEDLQRAFKGKRVAEQFRLLFALAACNLRR